MDESLRRSRKKAASVDVLRQCGHQSDYAAVCWGKLCEQVLQISPLLVQLKGFYFSFIRILDDSAVITSIQQVASHLFDVGGRQTEVGLMVSKLHIIHT